MLINRLHRFSTQPTTKTTKTQVIFWFSLSLTFAAIFGILQLQKAFCCEYVVHDDFRQHGFWMERFIDPQLFPQDLIADYFQSAGPPGHTALYQILVAVGIHPLLFSKILPVILILVATGYCFGICWQILPVPMAGFIATLLLNLNFWETADIASATPRAFAAPLLLAFLYYLLRRSLLPCLAIIALQGLFYPAIVFISSGILVVSLIRWENGRLRLSSERSDYLFCITGLAIAFLVLLPYELKSSGFGPTVTKAEIKTLPEFSPTGITSFDFNDPWKYWLFNTRSGIFRESPKKILFSPQIWLALTLPILLNNPAKFPLVKQVTSKITILAQLGLASLGIFLAAHVLLYKLFHPNRYSRFSLQVLLAIAAGIALTILLDAIFHLLARRGNASVYRQPFFAVGLIALLGTTLFLYLGFLHEFPSSKLAYRVGTAAPLYEFFAQQPKDITIASLAEEADNIPTFSKRSVLVAEKFALPYQVGYYRQIRQRTIDLIEAQYSPDLVKVQSFIQKYNVDFWLLDRSAFRSEYLAGNNWRGSYHDRWLGQYQPTVSEALAALQQKTIPALSKVMECSVFQSKELVVLQAECIEKSS